MHIVLLSLFPDALEPYLGASILGIAREKGLVRTEVIDFRDFTRDRHRTVDDRPYGGGPGMVLKPEPISDCIEWLERTHGDFHKVLLTPDGTPFRQARARSLASTPRILFLCGRYEGFDERLRGAYAWDEVSLGDFVLSGGELAALCITEAIVRLVPGVLGHQESAARESFENARLDHPHYTRPATWRGRDVPDVLKSGDHAAIERWRADEAVRRTRARRPDLIQEAERK
ncbi:MAG: tRNA (guanosine(37)-N1)-methyltransferase TrmD [Planctomycetota bacterium]